jgi:hypothetical protein
MSERGRMRPAVSPPPAEYFDASFAPAGGNTLTLDIGGVAIRLRGLPPEPERRLRERYGKFVVDGFADGLDVELCRDDREYFIDPPATTELNPVHLECDGDRVRFVGYRLAGIFDTAGGRGRALLAGGEYEPVDRALENYIRAAVAWQAAEKGGALVHAASAAWEGRGYLFYGESGAGKSTLAECNRRALVLSDDLSLVLPGEDGHPQLVGSPFRGTYEGGDRVVGRFPLVAGFRLVQDERAEVRDVDRARALSELVGNLPFVAEGFSARPDLFATVHRAFAKVPLKHLHFRRDDSYWDAIRDAGL